MRRLAHNFAHTRALTPTRAEKEHAKARRVAERSRSAQPNSEQELKKALESIRAEKRASSAARA